MVLSVTYFVASSSDTAFENYRTVSGTVLSIDTLYQNIIISTDEKVTADEKKLPLIICLNDILDIPSPKIKETDALADLPATD